MQRPQDPRVPSQHPWLIVVPSHFTGTPASLIPPKKTDPKALGAIEGASPPSPTSPRREVAINAVTSTTVRVAFGNKEFDKVEWYTCLEVMRYLQGLFKPEEDQDLN